MDPAQADQMIAWLDEEQRKGKAQIAELKDLIQRQAIELGDQRKRIEELQSRLTRLQTDVSRMTQVDQAVQQVKNELASVLHDVREELRKSDQTALQTRQIEREADAKAILELGQKVEQLGAIPPKLTALATEQQRLSEAITPLRQRQDGTDKELVRRAELARLVDEEQKRATARMDAIQQAVEAVRGQSESYAARLQYLERWAQGSAQRTAEWQAFKTDVLRVQGELQEVQRRSEQRIEKQLREWATVAEAVHRDQDVYANQLRIFAEQHERTKRGLAAMQDLGKELRMAQEETKQLTELASEKQRRELREWQGENEKRWTRYLAQWEYRWSEQSKGDDGLVSRIEDLEAIPGPMNKQIEVLREALADEATAARAATLELWRFLLEGYQRQVDSVKATADALHARLGE